MSRRREATTTSHIADGERAWRDVVRLGELIVAELGLQDSNDTPGRWMSHRLAELMSLAESGRNKTERDEAKRAASELIIRLWDHRAGWPDGWPPKATTALSRGSSRYGRREEPTGSAWLDALSDLDALQARERGIWIDLGLLDFDVESERRAAKELIGEAATEEREAIELVIRLWESAEQGMRESLGAEAQSPVARAKAGIERLKGLDSEREELRDRILEQVSDSREVQ
ncbi:MAG: hypothetical protein JXA57_16395 [Armatimonadetes bacterium]|nr:hypothetical protein [Armatimonadota bacterium]